MRFNKQTTSKTINKAGGQAYKQTDKLSFVSILLTSFLKDQFYRSADETQEELVNLFNGIDKKFAAKTAIYARTKFGMRSVSHLVAGEVAKSVKSETWTKNFFNKIVYRPDDMAEILSYYLTKYSKPIPNSLKKGFAQALERFDDYQLGKYRGERADLSLVDIVNLVHPKNTETIKKLVNGTLRSTDTWEVELSGAGQKAENEEQKDQLKKDVWIKLIKEKKIGYFALLRNLRNILEQAPEIIGEACEMLINEQLIKKSLVLPFRFVTALDQITETNLEGSREVIMALNKAIDICLSNVPKFDGKTLVVLDSSGSMQGQPAKIGSLFAATLIKSNNADLILFSDDAKYVTLNPMDSTITLANSIPFISGGTNFHAIFNEANKAYNRIIILSDMQGWVGGDTPVGTFNAYKARVGATPFIYSFDLQGYGTIQFPEPNVLCIAGFSEKIFDTMKMLETDKNAMLNEIESIEL